LGVLELRCYARERRLDFALALYDLRTVSPVMRELAALLPRASSVRQVGGWRTLAGLYRIQGELAQARQAAQRALHRRATAGRRRRSLVSANTRWRSLPTLQAT
jgi:hypothetical protein